MQLHKRKIFNFRYYFLVCLAVIAIIFLAVYVIDDLKSKIIFASVVAGLALIAMIVFLAVRRNKLALLASILLLAILPLVSLCNKQYMLERNKEFSNNEALIYGRICENYKFTDGGSVQFTIDEVVITNGKGSTKVDGKFVIFTNPQNLEVYNYQVGCYIETFAVPEFYDLESDRLSSISNGIIGSAYSNYFELELTGKTKIKLNEKIKNYFYQKLRASGAQYFEVGYAMLFGDTSFIDESDLELMRGAGIAHLLAVSGLHISLIVMLMSFVLRKLKISKLVNLIIISVLLIFYCYICGFSVSVLRASIMSMLSLYALWRGKPYDNLSALSFAAYVILLINPLKLFNLSFILSFGAVLAIILTSAILTRVFSKIFYRKFASTLAVSIGVQCGIIFTNLCYFGTYPILSILTNLISIPIQSAAFLILLVGLPFYLIFPSFSAPIKLFGSITGVVLRLNNVLSFANLTLTAVGLSAAIIPLSFIFLFILSDKTMCKFRWKAVASIFVVALISLFQFVF